MPEVATDKMSPTPPRDKHQLVYIICCWLGIGMLLPWNFFSQVNGYWMYKFRNIPNDTIQSEKQKFWGSNLALVSMAPNFTFLFINALIGHKLRYISCKAFRLHPPLSSSKLQHIPKNLR